MRYVSICKVLLGLQIAATAELVHGLGSCPRPTLHLTVLSIVYKHRYSNVQESPNFLQPYHTPQLPENIWGNAYPNV